jgi:hypothetical protein
MKTSLKQFAFVVALLFAITVTSSSFTAYKRNSIANGTGLADGISFNFNVVEQKDGVVVGQIQFGDHTYTASCARWFGNSAVVFTTDGHAFYICDNKGPVTDWISDPIGADCGTPVGSSDFYWMHCVGTGNIQVKE